MVPQFGRAGKRRTLLFSWRSIRPSANTVSVRWVGPHSGAPDPSPPAPWRRKAGKRQAPTIRLATLSASLLQDVVGRALAEVLHQRDPRQRERLTEALVARVAGEQRRELPQGLTAQEIALRGG